MTIQDRIYGRLTVNEPVIAELITSKPLQRLMHISQDGASHFITPSRDITRFEHSVGAWYLAQRYKRPIEEQIACLLHDVPHTAFSHVADVLMKDEKHEYHERFMEKIVLSSEVPAICKKYHVDISKVLDKHRYPLLENDLPDISFDRLDYFLRDGYGYGLIPKQTVRMFLTSLKERDNMFYFGDVRVASLYAMMYLTCDRLLWLDPSSHGAYFVLSDALRRALDNGILLEDDLFGTDATVMDTLRTAGNPEIDALLNRLVLGRHFRYAPEAEAEYFGPNKPRFVDPLVEQGGTLQRLSALIPGVAYYFEEFRDRYKQIGVVQQG